MDSKITEQRNAKQILLAREGSSMASCWTEYLCAEPLPDGRWKLSTCGYSVIGSIYDIPEDERYDDSGEFRVPELYEGRRVIGLADNEWLETDELVENEDEGACAFGSAELEEAAAYCRESGWSSVPGFDRAWSALEELVRLR